MKTLLLAATLLFAPGCLAQTEDRTPAVECGWYAHPETGVETCASETHAYSSAQRFEELDDGASACWIYDTVCVSKGTPAESVPDECRRTFVSCQPTDRGLGRP